MADQHKLLLRISCFCVAMSKCLTRTSVRWFDFAEFCGGIQSTEVWGVYHHNRGSWLRYACSQERTADRKRDRARKLPIHTKWPILSGWLSLLKIPEPSTAKPTHRNRVQTHQSSGSCHIQSTARINRHYLFYTEYVELPSPAKSRNAHRNHKRGCHRPQGRAYRWVAGDLSLAYGFLLLLSYCWQKKT